MAKNSGASSRDVLMQVMHLALQLLLDPIKEPKHAFAHTFKDHAGREKQCRGVHWVYFGGLPDNFRCPGAYF